MITASLASWAALLYRTSYDAMGYNDEAAAASALLTQIRTTLNRAVPGWEALCPPRR